MSNNFGSFLFDVFLVIIIALGLYLLYKLINMIRLKIRSNREKRQSIEYLENDITEDELVFLNRHFYNDEEKKYRECVEFDLVTGKAVNLINSLISNGVVYRPLRLDCDGYCFSLYPHILEYLNDFDKKLEVSH